MCKHLFDYPVDKEDNNNLDKETLVAVCRNCGIKQISYGMRWMIPKYDESWWDSDFLQGGVKPGNKSP